MENVTMSQGGPEFALHPQLARDCAVIGDLPLSRVLLMNDANYPWLILVPRRNGLRELYELDETDLARFWRESTATGRTLMALFDGGKLNVAALGNLVPQLHVHHVVRRASDAAWPRPVWGVVPPVAYTEDALRETLARLRGALAPHGLGQAQG
jgi:diadenosine tetraphosphate (Ap4A) HIT family hydrolase